MQHKLLTTSNMRSIMLSWCSLSKVIYCRLKLQAQLTHWSGGWTSFTIMLHIQGCNP